MRSPEVFLDLSVDKRRLGRVYIQLWGSLRRAQQFLMLVLCTEGSSYRGASCSKVESRNRPGECLRISHYMMSPEGGVQGSQGLLHDLEWGGEHASLKRAGLVVAASGGRAEYGAVFDICTRDHPTKKFSCPFGEVTTGSLGVVKQVTKHHPVSQVTISEVGVVLSQL